MENDSQNNQIDPVTGIITLKPERDKPLRQRHPWVFSGAIARIEGTPEPGGLVQVLDANGRFLATAYYNPHSQIRCRVLSWDADEPIDATFWRKRMEVAVNGRSRLHLEPHTTAYRLIFAESDLLPGLVVDKYGDYLVMQCLTMGIEQRKPMLAELLADLCRPIGILDRSDADVRKKEGLPPGTGLLWGEAPPDELVIRENEIQFAVNLTTGHKTGFYLDQRDNRTAVCHPHHIRDKEV
ncbi:MAG: class I SAM-dependent rRNA methyltransferase, partial [Anaerolineales bacterium]|nr:class I SAM-dependent rRNA methyltransferase [Anaerolineales bacterium]